MLEGDLAPILDVAFERDESWSGAFFGGRGSPEEMSGFDAHLASDPPRRVAELRTLGPKARAHGLRALTRRGLTDGLWFDFALGQAGDTAKSAREAAVLALKSAPEDLLFKRAEADWPSMKIPLKAEIARALWASNRTRAEPLVRGLAETERNAAARADLERLLGLAPDAGEAGAPGPDGETGYAALDGTWIACPPPSPPPADTPVTPELALLINPLIAAWRTEIEQRLAVRGAGRPAAAGATPPENAADRVRAVLNGEGAPDAVAQRLAHGCLLPSWGMSKARSALQDQVLTHPDLTIWGLFRALEGSILTRAGRAGAVFGRHNLGSAPRARMGEGGLRLLADVGAALGDAPDGLIRLMLEESRHPQDLTVFSPDALWPYFARHLVLIDEALGLAPPTGAKPLSEARAFDLLAQFPATPARYRSALLDRAIGDRKAVRGPARDLLAGAPDLASLLIPLLKHSKSDVRAETALWLAERGDHTAVEALVAAARKETVFGTKAALLGAISRLGGDIDAFISPEALLAEAEQGLKKTAVKGLEWFPFVSMPPVRRADGEALDPTVVRWWIILAAKLKQPGGNPWFDLLLDGLAPGDAGRLGLAVMSAWIARDTEAPTEAEANDYAAQRVDAAYAQTLRWQPDITRERVFASLRQSKLGEYFQSATDQKGVLALATRAPGAEAVEMTRVFLRHHYPRTAQCKALLECLASNPSPVATQFVLSISKRWRTRTVRELAVDLVAAIAERRGWTPDELADRTIPTGGFDDTGVLELPVGERAYAARLDEENKIVLLNPEGKSVQGLPSTAGPEAGETLAAAKALLSSARKEIKQVFDFQARRLYDALCVEREWPAEGWRSYLLRHPLMGRLVQRLVWLGLDEAGERVAAFRPLEDLTLTDAADAAVDPAAFTRVRLAHRTAVSDPEAAAWQAHLKDYRITPLFEQFGRAAPAIAGLDKTASELGDRRGWLIETFKLRGAATKLGYVRGQTQDGGWFYTYDKPFDALGLTAMLEFTGSGLLEENRPCALVALRFVRAGRSSGEPLGSLPPVLVSEAWADLHAIAAAGTGFDPEWEKKAQ
jgi:hypothetical protein